MEGLSEDSRESTPLTQRSVRESVNLHSFTFTINPKCFRKSAPMIGLRESAMMNTQAKGRRSPRLRLSNRFPYVGMGVLLTAVKLSVSGRCFGSETEGGMIPTSDPVSTRNRIIMRFFVSDVEKE